MEHCGTNGTHQTGVEYSRYERFTGSYEKSIAYEFGTDLVNIATIVIKPTRSVY